MTWPIGLLLLLAGASASQSSSHLVANDTKLTASDGEVDDNFGRGVSVSEDTLVVGAPNADGKGAVYVYRRVGGVWVFDDKLTAPGGATGDAFGTSVDIAGDYIVVGARFHGSPATGAAYVFERVDDTWTPFPTITAFDAASSDRFGASVAIDGSVARDSPRDDIIYTIVVGAPLDSIHMGAPDNSGSAYVFQLSADGSSWDFRNKLTAAQLEPPDDGPGDEYGTAVDISGDVLVIGARSDDDNGAQSGGAFTAGRINIILNWVVGGKLLPDDGDTSDFFGSSVAVDFDPHTNIPTYLVGARRDDDAGGDTGSVYVFRGGDQVQKLLADDAAGGQNFGRSMDIRGNHLVVGADGGATVTGAVYFFRRPEIFSDFDQQQKVLASAGNVGDDFGRNVAMHNGVIAAGAPDDNDNGSGSGAVYVYTSPLFIDDFETGDTRAWSAAVP